MMGRAAAIAAGILFAGTAAAQTPAPAAGNKPETSCTTTTGSATAGTGEEKTQNSMAMEKSAVLPEAGGHSNSAAPTVQSAGKPLEVRSECPPDAKSKG